MRSNTHVLTFGALTLAAAAAACSGESAIEAAASAPVTLTLQRTAGTAFPVSFALAHDSGRGESDGHRAVIEPALVDSIIVTVTEVHLIPARDDDDDGQSDSVGRGSPSVSWPGLPPGPGPMGRPGEPPRPPRRDTMPPDRDTLPPDHDCRVEPPDSSPPDPPCRADRDTLRHERDSLGRRFFALEVVGGGRIDLMHLPTEASAGIVVATGDVPPGDYHRVRLAIASGEIWLNTAVVTAQGDTLPANTAIPVFFPSGGVFVRVDFTVPEGGGEVPLVFDAEETLAHVIVTGNGRVIVTPVLRHRSPRP